MISMVTGNYWDYLVVTASNETQAQAYETQLCLRQQLGLLESVREVLVVPDPGGETIIVGVDVDEPLCLSAEMCIDVIQGRNRKDENIWFVRCYGVNDTFNASIEQGATFCGLPVLEWLEIVGVQPEDVWDIHIAPEKRSLWNVRIFPAIKKHSQYYKWLWMLNLDEASQDNYGAWLFNRWVSR